MLFSLHSTVIGADRESAIINRRTGLTVEENQGDQPLSSEELLRRAREGLGDSGTAPQTPKDFQIESYPPPAPDPEVVTPDASDEAETVAYEPPTYEPPVYEPPSYETPAAPPTSEPSSWAPPPVDSQDDTAWTAAAPPAGQTPTPSRRRSAGNTIWILVVVFVVGMGVFSLFDSSKTVDEIEVGDCLDMPEDDIFNSVDTIDCTEPHDLEVYAMVDMARTSSDFSTIAAYPGDFELYEAALDECLIEFETYVGVDYVDSVLYVDAFTPTIEGWEEFDDREVQCVLLQLNESLTDIIKSRRSFKNSGF